MKVAVLGLGVEGKKALNSLKLRGHMVYATDLNETISLENLSDVDLDLGFHDMEKINAADAVVLSPGLWNMAMAQEIRKSGKLLSDIKKTHRSIFTIGITGTNGKTTTTCMIKEIAEQSGLNVLVGGNAGGGFKGYTEVILQAESQDYDLILLEICDMTFEFCDNCFDLDLVVVTNLGRDHLDYHGSMDNYQKAMAKFLKGKNVILNKKDTTLNELSNQAKSCIFYEECNINPLLWGTFNKLNAGAAEAAAKALNIDEIDIAKALTNFTTVEGRIKSFNMGGSQVLVGKTDNADAIGVLLEEIEFQVVFIGTPRKNESWRLDILDEVSNSSAELIVLFPGLEDTVDEALSRLKCLNFSGEIKVAKTLDQIFNLLQDMMDHYQNILIAGNGQEKMVEIQKKMESLTN